MEKPIAKEKNVLDKNPIETTSDFILKHPEKGHKLDTSSSSSYFSSSNLTMSGIDTDEHDIEPSTSGCRFGRQNDYKCSICEYTCGPFAEIIDHMIIKHPNDELRIKNSYKPHSQTEEYKAKKKERVKEYLKELKSMVQPRQGGKMGTLSTLQHVLSRMRKIKDVKKSTTKEGSVKESDIEENSELAELDLAHTTYESDSQTSLTSESLKSNDELKIIISTKDHVTRAVSGNLKYVLGYPTDSWIGRTFDEYIHKKDLITFNSVHGGSKVQDMETDGSDEEKEKKESKIFYFRLRKFKSLGNSGYSLRKQDSYMPFQCMFQQKMMTVREIKKKGTYPSWYDGTSPSENTGSPPSERSPDRSSPLDNAGSPPLDNTGSSPLDHTESQEEQREQRDSEEVQGADAPEERKLCTIMYCVPLISPYSRSGGLPEMKTFETRHTLFCSYCNIQPNTIPLLGYLPQEMVGVSIFDFYHNDDLGILYNIYKQVISLKGVPYRSGPIRIRAKNGSWVTTKTEWSSFVNPWTKRLEFIIGKHTVIKGPKNTDVFSENYYWNTSDNIPEQVREAQQKIKDLLLQPVETVYVGSPTKRADPGKKEKSVAIAADASVHDTEDQLIPSTQKVAIESTTDQSKHYQSDLDKSNVSTGLLFKESSISRAYEQLNYTNGIKKFLLSQPRTYLSDSDSNAKRSSSEEGGKKTSSEEDGSDSIQEVPSDTDFDFEISVPKPPSFGSSTKVLVSEQEHREDSFYPNTISNDLMDPMSIREQLQSIQPPAASAAQSVESPISKPPESPQKVNKAQDCPVVSLTRESLWKHTLLQEQLYLATASPDRNILFTNKSGDFDRAEGQLSRKRSHSPDRASTEMCKSLFKAGRTNEALQDVASSVGVLNPTFPISKQYEDTSTMTSSQRQTLNSRYGQPLNTPASWAPVSMQMFPVMRRNPKSSNTQGDVSTGSSLSGNQPPSMSSGNVAWPYYSNAGVSLNPQVMVGFHQPTIQQPLMPQIGVPIPIHQLNSYIMQQAKMGPPNVPTPRFMSARVMQEQKAKKNLPQSSSEESSTEDTSSSLYLLESGSNVKSDYNQLMLALNMYNLQGLKPPPWLENVCFTPHVQLKYHLPKTKVQRQLKKDQEMLSKMVQSEMVGDQLEQLFEDISMSSVPFLDEEAEYLLFPKECVGLEKECSCVSENSCDKWVSHDHGISDVLQSKQKASKKEKRGSKPKDKNKNTAELPDFKMTPSEMPDFKMEVDTGEHDQDHESPDSDEKWPKSNSLSKSSSSLKTISSDNSSLKNELMEEVEFAEASDSVHSSNGSEMTPSDQRSNNENGSSMKESDGDAMSKKSDCSSDKQQSNSESESEVKYDKSLDKLFVTLNLCFPQLHKETSPWLVETELNKKVEFQYSMKAKDLQKTLQDDLNQMSDIVQPDMIEAQLRALFEDINDSGASTSGAIGGGSSSEVMSGSRQDAPQEVGAQVGPKSLEGAGEVKVLQDIPDNVQMVMDCVNGDCRADTHGACMTEMSKIDDSVFDSLFGNM